MSQSDREHVYRGLVGTLACAIYNDEQWDKQQLAALLHMGDPSLDYVFRDEPPAKLSYEDVLDAVDRIFERGGI